MGSAFNAITTIKRAVADPITDDTLPPPGALSWANINSPSALEGTTGIDCKLVHGDRWQQVEGSQTENFLQEVTTSISGNQKHSVTGDSTHKIIGNLVTTVFNTHRRTVFGPEYTSNLGTVSWNFKIHRHISEPHRIDHNLKNFICSELGFSATKNSIALVGQSYGATWLAFSLTDLNISAGVLNAGCTAASFTCEFTNQDISGDKDEIKALKGDIEALRTEIGALAHVPPESVPGIE